MITYQELEGIRNAMSKLTDDMKSEIVRVIEEIGREDPDALRDAIRYRLAPVMEQADAIAAELAAAVYNGWRAKALGLTVETVAESAYDVGKIEAMANTAAKKAAEGATTEQIVNIVYGRAAYDMRRSYGQTMIANAGRDSHHVYFARVPQRSKHYADGCPFCRMLSSRGFVYWSKKTAGEFDHYHPDCTCEVVAEFSKNPKVEGYDPEKLREEYYDARAFASANLDEIREGETVTEKEHARYRYGTQVGVKREDYGNQKSLQANDVASGYRALGLAKQTKPKKSDSE